MRELQSWTNFKAKTPFAFFVLFYETKENEKGDKMVDIYMYFGGKFRSDPNIAYIGEYKIGIWKNKNPNEMSIIWLWRMFKQVGPDATKVNF